METESEESRNEEYQEEGEEYQVSITKSLRQSPKKHSKNHLSRSTREERRGRPESTKMKNEILAIPKFYPVIWQAEMVYVYESSNKTIKTSFANPTSIHHDISNLVPTNYQHIWATIQEQKEQSRMIKLLQLLTKLSFGKDPKYLTQFFQIYFYLIEILLKSKNDPNFITMMRTSPGLNNLVDILFKLPAQHIREVEAKTEKNTGEIKYRKMLKAICYGFSATFHQNQMLSDIYLK